MGATSFGPSLAKEIEAFVAGDSELIHVGDADFAQYSTFILVRSALYSS